jgi:hypothetical protein
VTQTRYHDDHGQTVLGSFADLLVALGIETTGDLQEWADALVEPYVTLDAGDRTELVMSLDGGFSAVLEYPFSLEFFVETLTDLEEEAQTRNDACQ